MNAEKTINCIFPQEIPFDDDQEWVEFFLTNRSRFTVHFQIIPFLLEESLNFTVVPDSGFLEPQETSLVRIARIPGARREVRYRGNVSMSARSHVSLWEEKQIPPIEKTALKEDLESESYHVIAKQTTTKTKKVSAIKTEIVSVSPQELIAATDQNWVEFTVQNLSRNPIRFKIRGSRVEEFTAKPATGYIEPEKSETVRILRIQDHLHPSCSCERFVRFAVLAKEVTGGDGSHHDSWKSANGVCEKMVKCQFAHRESDHTIRRQLRAKYMKESFLRIKNWLRALNAILLGLVFVSSVLLLVGATVCYKIFLLVHLQHLTIGGSSLSPPLEAPPCPNPSSYISSWFCK